MEIIQSVQNRIYQVRGQRVILDKDIAFLYETETKSLNLSVKRHINRFPLDFMFQLTKEEVDLLRLQKNQVNDMTPNLRFQIETSSYTDWGGTRYLPHAFTEQGVAMLSGIINSKKAIQMNIAIMRAFVELRRILLIKISESCSTTVSMVSINLLSFDIDFNTLKLGASWFVNTRNESSDTCSK